MRISDWSSDVCSSDLPTEGAYDMGWLVRAVRLAAKYDIKVVIGTPTDTPPAWMTQKYPEVLRIDGDGKRLGHGGRRQFSISSTLYRQFSRDIVSHMADALGTEPNVMGSTEERRVGKEWVSTCRSRGSPVH